MYYILPRDLNQNEREALYTVRLKLVKQHNKVIVVIVVKQNCAIQLTTVDITRSNTTISQQDHFNSRNKVVRFLRIGC